MLNQSYVQLERALDWAEIICISFNQDSRQGDSKLGYDSE